MGYENYNRLNKDEKKRINNEIKARFPNETWAKKKGRKKSGKRRESTKLTEISVHEQPLYL